MSMTRGTNPEREAVKEYLQQYHDAKAKKQILEERHRTLSADLRDPGVRSAFKTMPTSKRQAREGGACLLYTSPDNNTDIFGRDAQRAREIKGGNHHEDQTHHRK